MPRFSPIFFITVFYVLGIVVADYVRLPLWVFIAALGLSVAFLPIGLKYFFSLKTLLPYLSFFLLGVVLTSFVNYSLQQSVLLRLARKETYLIASGTVESEPRIKSEWLSFTLRVDEVRAQSKIWRVKELTKVAVKGRKSCKGIRTGNKVKVEGMLSVPKNSSTSNQFNYKNYLYRRRIQTTLTSTSENLKTVQGGSYFNRQLHLVRDRVKRNAYCNLGRDKGSLLTAIVIGGKDDVPEGVMDNFRDAGLAHVLVISGLHVGLLAMALWGLLRWLI